MFYAKRLDISVSVLCWAGRLQVGSTRYRGTTRQMFTARITQLANPPRNTPVLELKGVPEDLSENKVIWSSHPRGISITWVFASEGWL